MAAIYASNNMNRSMNKHSVKIIGILLISNQQMAYFQYFNSYTVQLYHWVFERGMDYDLGYVVQHSISTILALMQRSV
jgi:hypothetical protein